MHPAPSIIVFTVLSGLGFGLIVWLGLGAGPAGLSFGWLAAVAAFGSAVAGLGASTLHLARPERAWRAFSQWRSSWLSREGVLAVATLATFGIYCALWLFGPGRVWPLGVLAAALALATVYATSMIYAQLRTVPRWATPLTPLVFLVFALAGGALAGAALSALVGLRAGLLLATTLITLTLGWSLKLAWWRRAGATTLARSAAGAGEATALGHLGRVRHFEPPHTGPNYLLDEMVFTVGRRRASALRKAALALGGILPALLVALVLVVDLDGALLTAALVLHLTGLLAERWLFFAEAEHTVAAYYGQG